MTVPGVTQVPGYHNEGPAYYFEEGKIIDTIKKIDDQINSSPKFHIGSRL